MELLEGFSQYSSTWARPMVAQSGSEHWLAARGVLCQVKIWILLLKYTYFNLRLSLSMADYSMLTAMNLVFDPNGPALICKACHYALAVSGSQATSHLLPSQCASECVAFLTNCRCTASDRRNAGLEELCPAQSIARAQHAPQSPSFIFTCT
jgi:hypothetical protein